MNEIDKDFLLKEYDNIAQAHFNTISTIAEFFKHYLVIMSLPITLIVFIINLSTKRIEINGAIIETKVIPPIVILLLTTVFFLIGVCLAMYIINLKFDEILYARTINGIRKHFTENKVNNYIVLPKNITVPKFFELRKFSPVVIAFSLLNAIYPGIGFWWYFISVYKIFSTFEHIILFTIILVISLGLHFGLYKVYAYYREITIL